MKKQKIVALVLTATITFAVFTITQKAYAPEEVVNTEEYTEEETITHAQYVWLHALEWCESSGNPKAINPLDLDGTASYGAFQFKPDTMAFYGAKYGVLPFETTGIDVMQSEQIMSRDIQWEILTHMLRDTSVRWERQFPHCVTKTIGFPPR